MYNSVSCLCLVLCIFFLSRASLPIPVEEREIQQLPNDISKIIAPESNGLEENGNDPPVYIMVPVIGDRSRRGAEDGNFNLENVSYEVPSYIRFNESAKGDVEVSLIQNPEKHIQQKSAPQPQLQASGEFNFGGNGGSNNNYCPPLNDNNKSQPIAPICLTLNIDNIFPPGKKIAVTNSSEIKGTGCVLRVKFAEAKDSGTTCIPTDFLGVGKEKGLSQELDSEKKRKFELEVQEDESATTQLIDQKTLQELIFKILTSNKNTGSTLPTEEVVFLEEATTEPAYSFLINPSILQRISRMHMTPAAKRMTTLKRQNSPDFDSLLKTVEQITSTMPKEKLLSLLSSLINKAALHNEMSSNQ